MAKITYVPKHEGDPLKTIFHGIKFEANKAVEGIEHALLIRQASKNPWFKVEGATPEQLAEPKPAPVPALTIPGAVKPGAPDKPETNAPAEVYDPNTMLPTTSEQYRGYALAWFKTQDDSEEMDRRWKEEAELRVKCGCGTDDEEYLATFYNPIHAQLKAAE